MTMQSPRRPIEGRDEMNLAEFPISALPRAQKEDAQGGKVDRLEFSATRYDRTSKHPVAQTVILTTTAEDGLPTPADEHVVLALLCLARQQNDFAEATVSFVPTQLFDIMGWARNSRSYERLRQVLRRLKALTIRYQNAWFDMAQREYEEELAMGIISGYRLARQTAGPRKKDTPLVNSITWTQQFHASLQAGNLKKLDLEFFFSLRSAVTQRLYRFLDKRFYVNPVVNLELHELACSRVGLAATYNVAQIKRRLEPAIAELEERGYLKPLPAAERFVCIKRGEWRIVFLAAGYEGPASESNPEEAGQVGDDVGAKVDPSRDRSGADLPGPGKESPHDAALELAREFYRLWNPAMPAQPGSRDREQAAWLLREHGDEAAEVIAILVQVTRRRWPDCRSLSGAGQKYLPEALKALAAKKHREQSKGQREEQRRHEQQQQVRQQGVNRARADQWASLPEATQREIEAEVRARHGEAPKAFIRQWCLEAMATRFGST